MRKTSFEKRNNNRVNRKHVQCKNHCREQVMPRIFTEKSTRKGQKGYLDNNKKIIDKYDTNLV